MKCGILPIKKISLTIEGVILKQILCIVTFAFYSLQAAHHNQLAIPTEQVIKDLTTLSAIGAFYFFEQTKSSHDPVTAAQNFSMGLFLSLAPCTYLASRFMGSPSNKKLKNK